MNETITKTCSKTTKNVRYCCVKNCDTKYRSKEFDYVRYYRFPTNKLEWRNERRQKWIQAVINHNKSGNDWQPKPHTSICSAHFVGGKKNEHPLHPAYNPTIFPGTSSGQKEKEAARFKNSVQQNIKKIITQKSPAASTSKKQTLCTKNEDISSKKKETPMLYDFQCQVNTPDNKLLDNSKFDYMMCNLKVDNDFHCAETQIDLQNATEISNTKISKTSETIFNKKKPIKIYSDQKFLTTSNSEIKFINFQGISSIHSNNELCEMCGVTFEVFNLLLKNLPEMKCISISNANRLLIFLMKLKQGISSFALAVLFNVEKLTIVQIFNETLESLTIFLKSYVCWPNKETVKNSSPKLFKDSYLNCRAIINYTEIPIEIPQSPQEKEQFYSNYKNCNNFKLFFTCAPNGLITYHSKCYSSNTSDEYIINNCGLLDLLESDDVVLAVQEFSSFQNLFKKKKEISIVPQFMETNVVNPIYVYIKQYCHQINFFKILSLVPMELVLKIDDIVQVCCSLINLKRPHEKN